MGEIMIIIAHICGGFFSLVGLLVFYFIFRKPKKPSDDSNRINNMSAIWYVMSHTHVFGGIDFFKNDIGENIRLVKIAVEKDLEK